MPTFKKIDSFIRLKNFVFINPKVNVWMDNPKPNVEYNYTLQTKNLVYLNSKEAFGFFDFKLEILPDVGKIEFSGRCTLEFPFITQLMMVLRMDVPEEVKQKNKPARDIFKKLVLRRCMDYSKDIGEKAGMIFHSYENFLEQTGLDKIQYHKF